MTQEVPGRIDVDGSVVVGKVDSGGQAVGATSAQQLTRSVRKRSQGACALVQEGERQLLLSTRAFQLTVYILLLVAQLSKVNGTESGAEARDDEEDEEHENVSHCGGYRWVWSKEKVSQ